MAGYATLGGIPRPKRRLGPGLASQVKRALQRLAVYKFQAGDFAVGVFGNAQPNWQKFTKTFTDFSDPGTSHTINLLTIGPKQAILALAFRHTTAFNVSSCTITLATGGVTVFSTGAQAVTGTPPTNMTGAAAGCTGDVGGAGFTVAATMNGAAALSGNTQGSADFYVLVSPLP